MAEKTPSSSQAKTQRDPVPLPLIPIVALAAGYTALRGKQPVPADDGVSDASDPGATTNEDRLLNRPATRGVVLGLSLDQIAERMRYLVSGDCPDIYYRLSGFNGGKDPTATDPGDRWIAAGGSNVNVTADCIGGMAWCGGWDRYQPQRFAHLYDGWINTDSMRLDISQAGGRCFMRLSRPEVGCFIVCASGSHGHTIGHIGGVIGGADEWADTHDGWSGLQVANVAAYAQPSRANKLTTGIGWYGADAWFVKSIMEPS